MAAGLSADESGRRISIESLGKKNQVGLLWSVRDQIRALLEKLLLDPPFQLRIQHAGLAHARRSSHQIPPPCARPVEHGAIQLNDVLRDAQARTFGILHDFQALRTSRIRPFPDLRIRRAQGEEAGVTHFANIRGLRRIDPSLLGVSIFAERDPVSTMPWSDPIFTSFRHFAIFEEFGMMYTVHHR